MLEKMGEFFDNRLIGYEEHMLQNIESATEFYPLTASLLPCFENAEILDLGCGTGLELNEYFKLNDKAKITGIDLAPKMLETLRNKFKDKNINLILGSYFDVSFGENLFDAAVSVESLHHFTKNEKIPLYKKLHRALKDCGYFILTDYFALNDEEEILFRSELDRLKKEEHIEDNEFYHYDTPLTVDHEIEALKEAGFSKLSVITNFGATYIIKAYK